MTSGADSDGGEIGTDTSQRASGAVTGPVATAALAVETIQKLLDLGSRMFPINAYQVLTTITNHTERPFEFVNYLEAHGKLLALQSLPVIPPAVKGQAPDPYLFPASFFVGGRDNALQAPAVLCQWKMAGRNVHLLVFIYAAGGGSSHAGFFGLYDKRVALESYWANAIEGRDWFYAGNVGAHCNATKFGLSISGSLSNNNPGSFVVDIHDA